MLIMLGCDFLVNGQGYYLEKSLLLTHTPFPLFFSPANTSVSTYKEQQPWGFLLGSVSIYHIGGLFVRRKTCGFV